MKSTRAIVAGLTVGLLTFAAIFFGCGSKNHDPSVNLVNLKMELDDLREFVNHVDAEFYAFKDETRETLTAIGVTLERIQKRTERCGEDCCRR